MVNHLNEFGMLFQIDMSRITCDVYLWIDLDSNVKVEHKPSIKNIEYFEKIKQFPYIFTKS